MSRRAIKRYEQVLGTEKDANFEANLAEDANNDDLSACRDSPRPRAHGLFDLLEDEGSEGISDIGQDETARIGVDSSSDGHMESSLRHDENEASENAFNDEELENTEVPTEGKSTKKKKKRKKKGKKRQAAATDHETDPDWIALNEADPNAESKPEASPGWIPSSYFSEEDGDDVRAEAERIMASVEAIVMAEQKTYSSLLQNERGGDFGKVLVVEPRLLNADAELKRLFGSRVIESERRGDEQGQNAAGRRRGRGSGRGNLRKKAMLVSPRDNWSPHAPGLVMELDKEMEEVGESRVRYYRYVHEASYARVQDEYRMLVGTNDPNMLVDLSSRYPYHVDTLLQLAEIYRQMGELDRAAEMVERCLYVLENCWNITFKPFDGSCRLRFDVLENRALYVALFRYSQLLTRRGMHRTALEISKLLLNFDPIEDPMGMLMLADSYALLSGEYKWIQDMQAQYKYIPLKYFPNFAASSAMAAECLRLGISGISNRGGSGKAKKTTLEGNKQEDDVEEAREAEELLTDTLLTFPMLLRPILSSIQDESGVWTEHRLFDEAWYGAGYEDHGVLIRMSRVYAERSKLLWNSSTNKQLLIRCARAAGNLDTAAGTGINPDTGRSTSAFVRDASKHSRVAKCRALRAEAGEWLKGSGLYQTVQIADFSDSTTNLPAELLAGEGAEQAVGATAPRDVTLAQSAMEFIQSLLPWRDATDAQ